jgi:hypothetical protein
VIGGCTFDFNQFWVSNKPRYGIGHNRFVSNAARRRSPGDVMEAHAYRIHIMLMSLPNRTVDLNTNVG